MTAKESTAGRRAPASGRPIRESWPSAVSTPEQRVPSSDARKFAVIEQVKTWQREQGATLNDIDGVRVQTADGWWLLRASNTQAILVARCEARSSAGLERLKLSVNQALETAGEKPIDWQST
jgi:phosphomannomutase